MFRLFIAFILSIAAYGQWDQVSDAKRLENIVAMNSTPPVKTVNIAPTEVSPKLRKIWYTSQASLAAANFLDAHSSWGKYELNPVLKSSDGRFGAKGVMLKAAIVGGLVAYQHIVYRKVLKKTEDKERFLKYASWANFGMTGLFTGVAIHNYQIPSPVDSAVRRLIVIQ